MVAHMKHRASTVRLSASDRAFYVTITVFLLFCFAVVAYPLINVVSRSLSSPQAVAYGQVWFLPSVDARPLV